MPELTPEQADILAQAEPLKPPTPKAPAEKPMSEMEVLQALVGAPRVVTITYTTTTIVDRKPATETHELDVLIQQVKIGRIPMLVQAAGPLMLLFTDKKVKLDFKQLMMLNTNECIETLAVLTEIPRETLNKLDLDTSYRLLQQVVEVNLDFFVQRILPLLYEGIQRLRQIVAAKGLDLSRLGGTSASPSSSETATT